MHLEIEMGFGMILLESDAKNIVDAVCAEVADLCPYGQIIEDAKMLLNYFHCVSVVAISRNCTKIAHLLARFAKNRSSVFISTEDVLLCVGGAVLDDISIMFS